MIKIQNVSKSYKKGNKVVDNLNLEINGEGQKKPEKLDFIFADSI